jgi:hypothetical protein
VSRLTIRTFDIPGTCLDRPATITYRLPNERQPFRWEATCNGCGETWPVVMGQRDALALRDLGLPDPPECLPE